MVIKVSLPTYTKKFSETFRELVRVFVTAEQVFPQTLVVKW